MNLRWWLNTALTAVVVTVPAWANFIYFANFDDGDYRRPFAIAATILTSVVALFPAITLMRGKVDGTESSSQSTVTSAVAALIGSGSIVSIMVNGGDAVAGLETIFAIAIAATAGAALVVITQVSTARSPAGVRESEMAEAVVAASDVTISTVGKPGENRQRAARASLGRQGVAAGFRQYGDQNESSARIFLFSGVLFFGMSVGAALWLVTRLGDEATVASILTRAAISIPGAVIFAVFVRESAARRRYAAWGGLIAIQAEHLGSFIADISSEEARQELEMQFARAVFRGGDVALERNEFPLHSPVRSAKPSEGNAEIPTLISVSIVSELMSLATSAAGMTKVMREAVSSNSSSSAT